MLYAGIVGLLIFPMRFWKNGYIIYGGGIGEDRRHAVSSTTDFPSAPVAQGVGEEVAGGSVVVRAETPQQGVCAPEEGQA